ncbi:hypothetical protein [[Mycoplasma] gypis]|uniref:Lipoprotein n=1 Tax=[Mycoplasma] gypis TaxID=92404 RepID=A0ABZ2RSP3_9BACT|nr:hypothetical protein [[Mycoplasma] gypis]MBN0919295.1 hypothetical protein [[Mycoplasma] gypis]
MKKSNKKFSFLLSALLIGAISFSFPAIAASCDKNNKNSNSTNQPEQPTNEKDKVTKWIEDTNNLVQNSKIINTKQKEYLNKQLESVSKIVERQWKEHPEKFVSEQIIKQLNESVANFINLILFENFETLGIFRYFGLYINQQEMKSFIASNDDLSQSFQKAIMDYEKIIKNPVDILKSSSQDIYKLLKNISDFDIEFINNLSLKNFKYGSKEEQNKNVFFFNNQVIDIFDDYLKNENGKWILSFETDHGLFKKEFEINQTVVAQNISTYNFFNFIGENSQAKIVENDYVVSDAFSDSLIFNTNELIDDDFQDENEKSSEIGISSIFKNVDFSTHSVIYLAHQIPNLIINQNTQEILLVFSNHYNFENNDFKTQDAFFVSYVNVEKLPNISPNVLINIPQNQGIYLVVDKEQAKHFVEYQKSLLQKN